MAEWGKLRGSGHRNRNRECRWVVQMDRRLEYLTRLRVGKRKAGPAPNKPCLLLAIICEIQSGHFGSPEVLIDKRLLARYHDLYEAATGNRHAANPQLPL